MRIKTALVVILLPAILSAQERVTVRGRIVNEKGEAVEYVQVGVPKLQAGTISTVDGCFEIDVPCDTLQFFHVSYQTASYPVTGPADDVVIVMHEQELPPAVLTGGDTREKYLVRPGTKVLGNLALGVFYRPDGAKGLELGSVAIVRKPFLIRDILFSIVSNHIPGCVASINVYRIEGKPETFINVLHKPVYVDIGMSDTPQDFDVQPEESILLEPGRYFIAFRIVAVDEDAVREYRSTPEPERVPNAMHMYTTLYFKSSYQRDAALGEFKHLPVNIGIAVKGLEYR
ncbi:MAG: hypothetical protein IJJ72_11310 [Bacteroidales bacterium]|nr:hypothetical protein [Bacteroidales bacterium]